MSGLGRSSKTDSALRPTPFAYQATPEALTSQPLRHQRRRPLTAPWSSQLEEV